jgi:hypothetical protein
MERAADLDEIWPFNTGAPTTIELHDATRIARDCVTQVDAAAELDRGMHGRKYTALCVMAVTN